MVSPCKKHSGFLGLNKGVRGLALAAIVAAGLVEGRALGQGTPNNISTPNPLHAITFILSGTNQYADSLHGQPINVGDPVQQIWCCNYDRLVPDPNYIFPSELDDIAGTIAVTVGTESITNTGIYFALDNSYYSTYNYTNNSINLGGLASNLGGVIVPSRTLTNTDFTTGIRALGNFSLANSDSGTIEGPVGGSGYGITAGVTNVTVIPAGQPKISIFQGGTNLFVSYSGNDAVTGIYDPLISNRLGVEEKWMIPVNFTESIYSRTNNAGAVSVIDQFTIPINQAQMTQPDDVLTPTNQTSPQSIFVRLGLR
jgi:hypothetical protein